MANSLAKITQRATANRGHLPTTLPTNSKEAMEKIERQHFTEATRAYAEKVGGFSSNCFEVECQGIIPDDFYRKVPLKIRVANVVQANTGEILPDDHKRIIVISPANVNYISQGAMLDFAGNTWLVYKPKNVGAVEGTCIVRRCNSVINKLDYYGNIVSVPFSFSKMGLQSNAPIITENNILSKNYFSAFCQLNEISKEFIENTRLILGRAAYKMSGIDNFSREYTNDPDSVHLMAFSLQREEPLEQDSIELQVADYHSFSWVLAVTAEKSMRAGSTQQIIVESIKNGDSVTSTEEYPIGYEYISSDTNVAEISDTGEITAKAEGECNITVILKQNPEKTRTFALAVTESGENGVAFTNTPAEYLREHDSYILTAAYFSSGQPTEDEVTFTLSEAAEKAYRAERTEPNSYKITCYGASKKPLKVTITAHGYSADTQISLIS